MKTALEEPDVKDPVLELIENAKSVVHSPDILRSVVLFSLSIFSVLNMSFVVNFWYESHMGGDAVDVYHMLFSMILTLYIFVISILLTYPLMELTWNHAKMGQPPLLTDVLDRLILLFCCYLTLGYILTITGLFGTVLPAVLFYSVCFFLLQRLGQLQQAKNEVSQIQSAYERLRRQHDE